MLDPDEELVAPTTDAWLPDVGDALIMDLLHSSDTALGRAVRRASFEIADSHRSYAAFGNTP